MKEDVAPLTVENFLSYVNSGLYDESIIHRTDGGGNTIKFVQGGEFYIRNDEVSVIPEGESVVNEFSLSNTRSTIAMAKILGQPNSATKSFFFNLSNNSNQFDSENGGYTVFGEVISGIEILDLIDSLQTVTNTPLIGYIPGTIAQLENYVYIRKAFVLSETFQITEGISGAWVTPGINGQGLYIEVLPAANVMILAWFTFDTESPDPAVPSTIGDAGNRWLTGSGTYQDNIFTGATFKTSGGLFDSFVSVVNIENGSLTIEFEDCANAIMSYILEDADESSTIVLQRVSSVNVAFCEALANESAGVAAQ